MRLRFSYGLDLNGLVRGRTVVAHGVGTRETVLLLGHALAGEAVPRDMPFIPKTGHDPSVAVTSALLQD